MPAIHRSRRLLIGIGLLLLLLILGFGIANALIPAWGATPLEQQTALPGDEIFSQPVLKWTHAATIQAPPEQVWPWLAQMGDTRAGYYSYRYIEKAVTAAAGIDASTYYNNTNQIHPEWQSPPLGQGMILDSLVLRDIKPGQYMVAAPPPGKDEGGLLWTWAISPVESGKTRLQVHMAIQIPGMQNNSLIRGAAALATFMMERKMIAGIKLHAEGGTESDWVQPMEALLWFAVLAAGIAAARRYLTRPHWQLPLAIALASVTLLFVLTYLQPALWLRVGLTAVLGALLVWDIRGTIANKNPFKSAANPV